MARPRKKAIEATTEENTAVEAVVEENTATVKENAKVEENKTTVESPAVQVNTSSTVTVCSNFPHDIKFKVPANGGTKDVIIKGNGSHLRGLPKGILSIGGYGMTTVDSEAWEWIKTVFAKDPKFKNGLIFATTASDTTAATAERSELRNGYEPKDPKQSKVAQEATK